MGDNRYYTFSQFSTFLVLFALMSIIILYFGAYLYRIHKTQRSKPFILAISTLFLICITISVEGVIPSTRAIVWCGYIVMALQLLLLFAILWHSTKSPLSRPILYITMLITLLTFGIRLYYPPLTPAPLFAELACYGLLILMFYVYIRKTSPFGMSLKLFEYVGASIEEYVFVINTHNEVVYRNKSVEKSQPFEKNNIVCTPKEHHVDSKVVSYQNIAGLDYIELPVEFIKRDTITESKTKEIVDDTKTSRYRYFSKTTKAISEKSKPIGYLVLFTDITELVLLLQSLELQKIKAQAIHRQLEQTSKIAYHIEQEQQISQLLHNIISSREQDMKNLTKKIRAARTLQDPIDFHTAIEECITYNMDILEDVRKTVTEYKQFYGGTES